MHMAHIEENNLDYKNKIHDNMFIKSEINYTESTLIKMKTKIIIIKCFSAAHNNNIAT